MPVYKVRFLEGVCVSDYVCSRSLNNEAAQDRLELLRRRRMKS